MILILWYPWFPEFNVWTSCKRLYYSVFPTEETAKVCKVFFISVILWLRIDVIAVRKTVITIIILMIAILIFLLILGLKTKQNIKLARDAIHGLSSIHKRI